MAGALSRIVSWLNNGDEAVLNTEFEAERQRRQCSSTPVVAEPAASRASVERRAGNSVTRRSSAGLHG